MHPFLLETIEQIEQANIHYVVMRDGELLEEFNGGEVDVLVQAGYVKKLTAVLKQLGYRQMPSMGYAPHRFFIKYDETTDSWIKLDIVDRVSFGRPLHILETKLAKNCLDERMRCGRVYVPTPEDELMTMLLHCVLDKGKFAPHRARRLQELSQEVSRIDYLNGLLKTYWDHDVSWPEIKPLLDAGGWDVLLNQGLAVAKRLEDRQKWGTRLRYLRQKNLRRLTRLANWIRPQAPMVTLLAPDGAGKSTLAAGLEESFFFPVQLIYMGLYQKDSKRSILAKIPGLGLFNRLFTQWKRYLNGRYHQAKGRLIVFDRYGYDAMLPSEKRLSRGSRARRWLLAHACPDPDVVLFLDAPGAMLYARKGEHTPEILEKQRQGYLSLKSRIPHMQVVDVTQDAEMVRRQATSLIWQKYAERLS